MSTIHRAVSFIKDGMNSKKTNVVNIASIPVFIALLIGTVTIIPYGALREAQWLYKPIPDIDIDVALKVALIRTGKIYGIFCAMLVVGFIWKSIIKDEKDSVWRYLKTFGVIAILMLMGYYSGAEWLGCFVSLFFFLPFSLYVLSTIDKEQTDLEYDMKMSESFLEEV